jgi:hypothetical protein
MDRITGPFDVAVLIRTVLRPTLGDAVRSIFAQDFGGKVQILVGIDGVPGDRSIVAQLMAECPARMRLDVFDMPYSTSRQRGGVYSNATGGALPVLLAYAANSRYVVYLDDDNWAAPNHLDALRRAVEGFDWAFTLRRLVDGPSGRILGVDEWESVGPGKGGFARKAGGFVDPNCMIIDKLVCHFVLPWFAVASSDDGRGADRHLFFNLARHHSVGWTGLPTLHYRVNPGDQMNGWRALHLAERGVVLPEWLAALADQMRATAR